MVSLFRLSAATIRYMSDVAVQYFRLNYVSGSRNFLIV